MATISSDPQPAKLTIPAAYLADARNAAVREVDSDSGMLRANQANDSSEDRDSAACILGRDVRLLEELLAATGDIEVTSEQDSRNCPVVDMLEEMVRLLAERLTDAAAYAPIPMDDVLDVAERLRWAAGEAARIEPGLVDGSRVTLSREQRDGLCDFIHSYLTGHLSAVVTWEQLRESRSRIEDCSPILDHLGWDETGDEESYTLLVNAALLRIVKAIRRDVEQSIRDCPSDDSYRAALAAVDLIEVA